MSIEDQDRQLSEHRRSFDDFRHFVTCAAAHVALTLACIALAFLGHSRAIALLLWLAGTLVLSGTFAFHRSVAAPRR
jgi:hypothetical protein